MKYKISDLIKLPDELLINPNSSHCSQCGRDFYAFNNGYNKVLDELANMEIELDEEKIVSWFPGFISETCRYNLKGEDLWMKLAHNIASQLPRILNGD